MSEGVQHIRLHQASPPVDIPSDNVYFAFASGRLSYDCVTCNAKCCRGHGYLLQRRDELQRHLAIRPHLKYFIDHAGKESRRQLLVKNCPPACFFLNTHGLCTLHVEDGYDAKPETCRLFPFNVLRRVANYVVVTPHSSLCPLEISSLGAERPESTHQELLKAMASQGAGVALWLESQRERPPTRSWGPLAVSMTSLIMSPKAGEAHPQFVHGTRAQDLAPAPHDAENQGAIQPG